MRRTFKLAIAALLLVGLANNASADGGEATPGKAANDVVEEKAGTSLVSRFRSSVLFFDQSITPETLDASKQLSYIPSYQWWISFRPRFYVTPKFSLRLRADLTVEWTNAADTTTLREGQWGDIWTDGIYDLPSFWKITGAVGLRAIWGTSKDSQGNTSVVRLGPTAVLDRAFPTRIGEFGLSVGMYALYNFVQNTSAQASSPFTCQSTDFTPTVCGVNTGAMNAQVNLTTLVMARYSPIPRLTISADYIVIDNWLYRTPDATLNDAQGGLTAVPRSPNDQGFRQASWFLASVDFDINKWFSMSLGYYCYRPILDPDGTYGNPFYAPNGASRIFLTGTFALDKLYMAIASTAKRSKPNQAALSLKSPLSGTF
jgi:hypothetical protein